MSTESTPEQTRGLFRVTNIRALDGGDKTIGTVAVLFGDSEHVRRIPLPLASIPEDVRGSLKVGQRLVANVGLPVTSSREISVSDVEIARLSLVTFEKGHRARFLDLYNLIYDHNERCAPDDRIYFDD